jgi:hypothetical protein
MALEKHAFFERKGFEGKLIAKNAYWKIEQLSGNKNYINVEICATLNGEQIERFVSVFTPDLDSSDNFIKQAYEHLKTLPDFSNAVDC